MPATRPRVRSTDGHEVSLATYGHFASEDLLTAVVMERMPAGVATRRHARVAEPVGEQVSATAKSSSKSSSPGTNRRSRSVPPQTGTEGGEASRSWRRTRADSASPPRQSCRSCARTATVSRSCGRCPPCGTSRSCSPLARSRGSTGHAAPSGRPHEACPVPVPSQPPSTVAVATFTGIRRARRGSRGDTSGTQKVQGRPPLPHASQLRFRR